VDSIDYAYDDGSSLAWMMSQSMRKVVRKIKDTAGAPVSADVIKAAESDAHDMEHA